MNRARIQASVLGPRASESKSEGRVCGLRPAARGLILALAIVALALPSIAQVTSPKDIKTPPLRKLQMPQPKRVQLGSGMVILLMEDHELPLIRGTANIRGGERNVPSNKAGLIEVLSATWRTGGTQSKTGDELDDLLEARAARVETTGDDDSTAVTIDVLKGDFDTVFPIFLDVLRNPAFRQDKIDLAKTRVNTEISRRNDEPGEILGRELTKLGYGPDSPYARQPEYATVAAITRDDLLAFHKRFVVPNNLVFGIVGDFDTAAMEKKLRAAFGSWPRGEQAPPPPVAMTPAKPGVYFVAKSDVTQANIGLVHPTNVLRSSPDYFPVLVMNNILSYGFSGRLMNHLRSQKGLTYGVGGGIGAQFDYPGLFEITMSTKSGTTLESIDALRTEVNALLTQPFTAEEMRLAKEAILNRFIFSMDSRGKVLNQAAILEFYGYPADYFQKYTANVEKVTAEDVARAAKKYVSPDKVAFLVVGNEKDFEKPLSTLGTVTPVDITIPEPGGAPSAAPSAAKPAAPATTSAEAAALVKKVQDFVGGKAKIDAISAVRSVTTANRKTPQGPMDMEVETLVVFPDRQRAVMKMPMGEVTMVVTPDASFMVLPGMGTRDVPSSQRDAAQKESRQELLSVLKNPEKSTFNVVGTEKVGAVEAKIVEVNTDGDTMKWYVDPATGKIVRRVSRGRGPMAQGDQVTDFTSWGTFGGITLPTGFSTTSNGEQIASGQVKTIEINPAIDPKIWQKPAQ
ncbi:MAG TPA: pitrilysin family protein [Thermoanaerobaculia bacterium]|nr:pitrilysin family protein [Thermoanaerobaculia bacterium]